MLSPTNAEALTQRGETYRQLGRYDEALADLTQAITLDPANTGARGGGYAPTEPTC